MKRKVVSLILLGCAATVAFLSLCFFFTSRSFDRQAIRTQAVVTGFTVYRSGHTQSPYVSFTLSDGRRVERPAQPLGSWEVRKGDTVEIAYTHRKVFGLDALNIYIVTDKSPNPYRIYGIVAALLAAVAAALLAAAAVTWLR